MGKIKKILENELIGGTQNTDVYPVTSIKAVYDENNERLDNVLNRRGVVNISTNYNSDHTAEVLTLAQAIAKVPTSDRVLGFNGTFLSNDGWESYQFTGDSISDWTNTTLWKPQIKVLQELGDSTQFPVSQKVVSDNLNLVNLSDFYYAFGSDKINLLNENTNENFKGVVISCEEGDTFKIKGSGGSAIYLYAFIDKDWKPIENNNSGASATINTLTTITAGQGAKWLVVNFNITQPYKLIDCRSIKDISVNNDLKSLKEQINIIKNGGSLNLNLLNNKEGDAGVNTTYETALAARNSVPFYFRFKGLCVLYKLKNIGWVTEQYTGLYPNSTTWADDGNWIKHNIKSYTVIAASDSTGKANADIVCSGQSDNVTINLALDNNNVLLLGGTFNITAPITLSRSNSILKGLNSVIVNNGSSNSAIITSNNSRDVIVEDINCGNSVINLYSSGSGKIINCFHRGRFENDSNITVKAVQGLSGINDAISKLQSTGGTILLEEGIYEGSDAVNLTKSNIQIIGKGRATILNRSTGYNEIICNVAGVKNCIIKDLYITNSVQHNNSNRSLIEDFRLENCWINTRFTNEIEPTILTVGSSSNFNTLSSAINYVTNAQLKNKDQHYEIHIYGDITETNLLGITLSNVDIIGHNTKITLHGDGDVCARFYGNNYKVSNIHFYKTGCYNGYQHAAAVVFSDSVTFENCIFENASFSTAPFNQEDYVISAEETKGCRRHGILVYCNKYGAECKTIFKNCVAIGSPFAYQNTRGWYLVTGAPKLYDCIGYGGGVGEFGHGIQNHRTSKAELHNCVGYAGKNSYRQAAGIRMQAMGSPNMIGCIGYGSCGVKMKYLGFSQEEIEAVGGSMNLTVEQAKTKLVELNANIEESYGISMWANNGIQSLVSCEGFAGSGINSSGLHIIADASPKIIGGIFGKEDISTLNPFIKDDGHNYMTFTPSEDKLNKFTPYEIETVNVTIVKSVETNKVGYKFYLETVEDVPQIVVDGQDMYGVTSIMNCTINKTIVPANTPLRAYVKDNNGNMVNLPDDENPDKCTLWVCMIIKYADSSIKGIHIADTASPQILSSKLNGSLRIETSDTNYIVKDCIIEGDITSNKDNLRVYDCAINGNVDSNLTFSTKNYVNDSSNFNIKQ